MAHCILSAQTHTILSIVFSAWKTTLDIMASIFDVALVPYFRIHGSIPASRRSKVLDNFEQSTTTRVLLITLGTGAVGYALVVAMPIFD